MTCESWPIVVGGCHRSGTSLVRRLLNAHSRIHCGPEVKFFRDFYGDYADDPLSSLRFMATARTILPEPDLLDVLGAAFVTVHERAAARAGKPRWADKTPENVLHLTEWQRLLGDRWLFVHVVRNPLDTLASIKEARFPRTFPADLEGRIAFYERYTRAGLVFGGAHPDRYYRLSYEALVHSPEAAIHDLMGALGETFEPGQLTFNDVPQQDGLEDPKVALASGIHAGSVERWPTILSAEEAEAVRRATGDLWALVSRDAARRISTAPAAP